MDKFQKRHRYQKTKEIPCSVPKCLKGCFIKSLKLCSQHYDDFRCGDLVISRPDGSELNYVNWPSRKYDEYYTREELSRSSKASFEKLCVSSDYSGFQSPDAPRFVVSGAPITVLIEIAGRIVELTGELP